MRLRIAFLMLLAMLVQACASTPPADHTDPADVVGAVLGSKIRLVAADDGAAVLGQSDAYTKGMGDFELSLRTRTTEPATEADYLAAGAASALGWEEDAREPWAEAVRTLAAATEGLTLDLPDDVLLIHTQPDFDVGAPHTRGPAVILPGGLQADDHTRIVGLLAHELFHVASRHDPTLRDRLFPLFGYRITEPVPVPDAIASVRLTNPDAHEFRHAATVTTPDGDVDVVAMLSVTTPLEEAVATENLFSLLKVNLVAADGSAVYSPGDTNFAEVVGINTGYIIHPEEVVADNFTLLCLRRAGIGGDVPKPEFIDKLEAALSAE